MDGTRAVRLDGFTGPRPTANITETFETAVESLKPLKRYVNGRGWQKFEPAKLFEGRARQTGTRLGVPVAGGFEVYSLGGG